MEDVNARRPGRLTPAALVRSTLLAMLALSGAVLALDGDDTECSDLRLSEADLTKVLDSSLGSLRDYVVTRQVLVDSSIPACYLKMSLDIDVFGAVKCTAKACSTAVHEGGRLGIQAFKVAGCNAVFDLTGASRHVGTSWTDVEQKAQTHCGRPGFELAGLKPQGSPGSGSVLLSFKRRQPGASR